MARIESIKTSEPVRIISSTGSGVIHWGARNDVPDKLREIVAASGTASGCLDVYYDFLVGKGLKNKALENTVVNSKGHTLGEVNNRAKGDFARYGAYCLHVNINANYNITEITHIPFDNFRLGIPDEKTNEISYCKIYDNWGKRKSKILKDISGQAETYPLFSFDIDVLKERLDAYGGFANSNGFIRYFNPMGENTYPEPIYLPQVTNMRSEEGLHNVLGRNICNNFLTAGAIVDIMNDDPDDKEESKTKKTLKSFSGDFESCQLMYLQVRSKEEIPQFIPFQGTNYDKQYTFSAEFIPDAIGRIFKQPAILRMENVAEGLSSSKMREAYTIYNTVTQRSRDCIDIDFTRIIQVTEGFGPDDVVDTQELSFNAGSSVIEKYGADAAEKVIGIVLDTTIDNDKKFTILTSIYGIDSSDVEILLA